MGAGRSQLARRILGAHASEAISYLPEDRKTQGLWPSLNVSQHTALGAPDRVKGAMGFIKNAKVMALSRHYIRRLRIKALPEQDAFSLSGGNQQKLVLARCLASRPKVLILDEPTRGVDVGAKAEIHRLILNLAAQGLAVLLISSELPELFSLSDRILVLKKGQVNGEFKRGDFSQAAVMQAAI